MIGAVLPLLRLAPYAASGILVAALWWAMADRAQLMNDLTRARAAAEAEARARAALATMLTRERARSDRYRRIDEEIDNVDDNTPLPGWLRDLIGRMQRPASAAAAGDP